MVKRKAKVNSLLPMAAFMKENLNKTKSADPENIHGPMVNSMKVSGAIIKCMEKVP
jgi:hypothetical protein